MDKFDTFKQENKVIKSIFSIRKKGVWIEKVFDYLRENGHITQYDQYYSETSGVGYTETYYKGTIQNVSFKLCLSSARLGLPDLSVGVDNKKDWIIICILLRENNLVR